MPTLIDWGRRGLHWRYDFPDERKVFVAHIYVPNCIQVNMMGEALDAGEVLHVFHCKAADNPPTYEQCLAAATTARAWFDDLYKTMVHGGIVLRQVTATSVAGPPPQAQATLFSSTAGTRHGDPPPSGVTCNLVKTTDLAGRSRHGAIRSWPMVLADLVEDVFLETYLTDIRTALNTLLSNLISAGVPMAVRSLRGVYMTEVKSIETVNNSVDSQKTRLKGRGR